MTIEEIKNMLDELIEETELIGKEIHLWGVNRISGEDCRLRQRHRNNLKLKLIEAIQQYVSLQREEAFDIGYSNGAKINDN